ncbi:uncharacterized protein TNCV_3407741 [Trichonephila clavipes]|nr:uncharacterized protein TNCV_3407741 [Trichonephila clavipes]
MSKKTNTAEEKYDSYELEVLAIINALKKFRVYLLGQHFKIVTDCSAFQKTMQKKELITRIARWALQLEELLEQREFLRNDAKKNIETLQSENRKTYNSRRKKASLYKEGDLVAIQRTQFGAGLKLRPKFLGPYKVTKVNSKDRYEVEKVGQHDGPNSTTTSADLMKHFYA